MQHQKYIALVPPLLLLLNPFPFFSPILLPINFHILLRTKNYLEHLHNPGCHFLQVRVQLLPQVFSKLFFFCCCFFSSSHILSETCQSFIFPGAPTMNFILFSPFSKNSTAKSILWSGCLQSLSSQKVLVACWYSTFLYYFKNYSPSVPLLTLTFFSFLKLSISPKECVLPLPLLSWFV